MDVFLSSWILVPKPRIRRKFSHLRITIWFRVPKFLPLLSMAGCGDGGAPTSLCQTAGCHADSHHRCAERLAGGRLGGGRVPARAGASDVHGQPMPDIRLPSDGPRAGCSFHESVFGRPMPEVHLPSDISRADPETVLSRQERRFYRRSKELMEQIAELSQGDIVQDLKGHYENMQNQQAHFAERCSRLPGDPCLTNNRMKSHNAAAAAAIYNYKRNSGM